MAIIKKDCLGEHSYAREACYNCPQRIECMQKKFDVKERNDEWGEGIHDEWGDGDKPNCFGGYKGTSDCSSCAYQEDCSGTSKVILRKTQQKRCGGKYKARGKEKERDVF